MILSKPVERLYLQRDGAQNVVIDLPTPLPQHQIDGIRFLFKLYKKKAPGAILNDPSGYGKCLQVVLFLNAVRPLLKKPILILTNTVDNWVEHFQIWTNSYDDLAIKESNPFSKSQIFVNGIQDGAALSRRAWGVVVLHDEGGTGELLKTSFNADYRIWVTSDDLKENLYTLASVYECLHPNQRFNVELFTARQNSRRDVIEKALLLDAFMEDFLIRRTDFLTPFLKYKNLKSPSSVKVSRKNKDPTGTKVKRSKRRILDDDDNNIETNRHTINRNNDVLNEVSVSNNNDNNMDNIESNGKETSRISVNVAESMDIDFTDAVKEIERNENKNHSMDQFRSVESPDRNTNRNKKDRTQNTENSATQEYMLEIEENDSKDERNGILVPATEEGSDSQSIFAGETNTIQKDDKKDTEDYIGTRKSVVYIPETESENIDVSSNMLEGENVDFKIDDNVVNEKSESVKGDSSNNHEDKRAKNNDNMNSKANKIMSKKSIIDELDAELAAFEAKALKKIKGSILDSLF